MIDLSGYMLSVQCLKFIMAIGIIIYSQHLIWVVLAAPTSTRIFKMTVSNFRIKTSTYEKFIAPKDFMVHIANNLWQAYLNTENSEAKATLVLQLAMHRKKYCIKYSQWLRRQPVAKFKMACCLYKAIQYTMMIGLTTLSFVHTPT